MEDHKLQVLTNKVWEEAELAFSYSKKIRIYTDRRRNRNRLADAIIILLVCFTSFSFLIDGHFPLFVSILSSIAILAKQMLPIFIQSESDLSKLDNAADFFAKYLVDMDKFYYNLMHGISTPDECSNDFYKLRKSSTDYYTIVNRYYRGLPEKYNLKVKKEFDEYTKSFKASERE